MISRKQIDEKITFNIPVKEVNTYTVNILWQDLLNVRGVLPTDILDDIHWVSEQESGFGKMDDELKTYEVPKITVIRRREENEGEYFQRLQREESVKRKLEETERNEYLRLKAKFETNE